MSTKYLTLTLLLCLAIARGQQPQAQHFTTHRCYVGSSMFLLGNLWSSESPQFFQLNAGYWLSKREVLGLQAKTWRYFHPLGIPYGDAFGSDAERYPGYVRGYGIGLAYQYYWWRGLYTAIEATPLLQRYMDNDNRLIKKGFQLFAAFRVGYHIEFMRHRLFIEPSIALTSWPVNTGMPEGFRQREERWPSVFFPEPGMHFGYKF